MKSLKDVKPGDKIFVLNSNRGYLKEPQIEILTANKVRILVDLNKKRLATCKKCGKTNKECFPTTIEEYDMYIEMLCENCLTEILNKKITAIKPKKNRITRKET